MRCLSRELNPSVAKFLAENIATVSDFKKTPFLKKINPPASPGAKKKGAGWAQYRLPKKMSPAHAAPQTWVGVGFEPPEKIF